MTPDEEIMKIVADESETIPSIDDELDSAIMADEDKYGWEPAVKAGY